MTSLQVLLHLCHLLLLGSAILQPPMNLRLSSNNFQHLLTWEELNNESLIYYCVEYSKDFSVFKPVTDCCNITTTLCDLTKYYTDIAGSYRTSVHSFTYNDVSNKSHLPGLTPFENTILGPPIVDVVACESCINISIHPPVSYLWSEKENRNVTMLSDDVYPVLDYTIYLSTEDPIYMKDVFTENFSTVITSLLPSTNYCVSVRASTVNTDAVESAKKCVVTQASQVRGDRNIYFAVTAGVVIVIGLLLILFSLDRAGCICSKKIFAPKVLQSLPNWNTIYTKKNELMPLVSLISMETKRSNEDEESYMETLRDINSYIANNADNRAVGQQQPRCQDIDGPGEGGISTDHSAVLDKTTLGLSGVILSEDPSDQNLVASAEDNILRKHPKVIAVSGRCTKVPPENTIMGISNREAMASKTANNISESLNLPFNGRNIFKIDLNTVSLADPEDLCKKVSVLGGWEVSVSPHADGDPLDTQQFRLLTSVFGGDEPIMINPEYNNNKKDMPNKDGTDGHLPSDYIRR